MRSFRKTAVLTLLGVSLAVGAAAGGMDSPVFLDWLKPNDPGDQVIRVYWERVEAGEASAQELVDLGTMLFFRGYPKDAVRLFRRALKQDDSLAEAWFRMGAVYHSQGELKKARRAYKKCIKNFPGHGWCNFYLGLCDEQLGKGSEALHYYRRAYRYAPELMNPKVNPVVLYSKLQAGARVPTLRTGDFKRQLPLDYLEADKVAEVRSRFEPTPTPKPVVEPPRVPAAVPTPHPTIAVPYKAPPGVQPPEGPAPVVRPAQTPKHSPKAAPQPKMPPRMRRTVPKVDFRGRQPMVRPKPSGTVRPLPEAPPSEPAATPVPTPTPNPG